MKNLWYYSEDYETSIYEAKKPGRLPKTTKLRFIMDKAMVIFQNN